ncbi:MAG: 4-hydroxy-tetrahydrodipicolinate synthase [Gammaproteobacteria bacterium]
MRLTGSLVALVTPMQPDGAVDETALESLIDWHVAAGTQGLVIAGTTGESPTLTSDEHARLIRQAVECAAGRIPVIAGTGSNSTVQTLDLSERAAAAGAEALMLVVPYYNKPPQRALAVHFRAVAAAVELPILLYNVPSRTVTDLLPATVAELAEVPNIVGIKEASARLERVTELRRLCGPDFLLFSGDDATAAAFMLAGGDGVVSVSANVVPERVRHLCDAACAGDLVRTRWLDGELATLNRALFVESNPIPVKWALKRMGKIQSGIRLPLLPLDEAHRATVEAALTDLGVLA